MTMLKWLDVMCLQNETTAFVAIPTIASTGARSHQERSA